MLAKNAFTEYIDRTTKFIRQILQPSLEPTQLRQKQYRQTLAFLYK